jgi:hypothetical protein
MKFVELWDEKVSKLAKACLPEKRLLELFAKGENYEPNDDEKKYLEEISQKYKDLYGMYYISDMCWRIEHALADHRTPMAKIAILNVVSTLDSESYFQNVFGGDAKNEEWKNLDALRKGLHELMDAA